MFDHTGANDLVDEYIRDTAFNIVYDYENSIKLRVNKALKSELNIDTYTGGAMIGNLVKTINIKEVIK